MTIDEYAGWRTGPLKKTPAGARPEFSGGLDVEDGSFRLDLNTRLPLDPPRFGPQSVGAQLLLGYDRLTG